MLFLLCLLINILTEEDTRDLLVQLPAPIAPAGIFQYKQSTMGKQQNKHKRKKILDRYNLLCIKKKKKPTTEHSTAAN